MKYILGLLVMLSMSACKMSVDDKVSDIFPASPTKPTVIGPDITGTWMSACQKNNWGYPRLLKLEFTKTTFKRTEAIYQDNLCQTLKDQSTINGTYRFVENRGNDSYVIEYTSRFIQEEKYKITTGAVYVNDMIDNMDVNMSAPIYKVQNPKREEP